MTVALTRTFRRCLGWMWLRCAGGVGMGGVVVVRRGAVVESGRRVSGKSTLTCILLPSLSRPFWSLGMKKTWFLASM